MRSGRNAESLGCFQKTQEKKRQNVKVSRVLSGSVSTDCLVKRCLGGQKNRLNNILNCSFYHHLITKLCVSTV